MSGSKIATACCVISRSVCSTRTETVPLSKDDSPTSSFLRLRREWKAAMKLHLLPPCWRSEAGVSGSGVETLCKHWRRKRGGGFQSSQHQNIILTVGRGMPHSTAGDLPPTRHKSPYLLSLHPLSPCSLLSASIF